MTEFDAVSYRAKFSVSKNEVRNEHILLKRNEVVYVKPLDHNTEMIISNVHSKNERVIVSEQPLLMISHRKLNVFLEGHWLIERMAINRFATLMAFTEYGQKETKANSNTIIVSDVVESFGSEVFFRYSDISRNLEFESDSLLIVGLDRKISNVMDVILKRSGSEMKSVPDAVFRTVRNNEGYWLAQFLLRQVINTEFELEPKKITHACKEYGVSESYFRKMCHHTFTRAPKQQMKIWRAAHSALQLIENNESIATIAAKNGYSSSSHFSVEIKKYFGVTPREFKRLEGFFK